jgi:23S rRNA pseudouridine1911/1915/1917 synthase
MTRIIYKTPDFLVIYKPAGVPSQSDKTGDADAMTITAEILRSMGEDDSLFLIHRLDRVVGGLMLFARNKKYAALLSSMVAEREFKKEYLAVAEGEMTDGQLVDYIYKDSILNRAVISSKSHSGAKRAELEYKVLEPQKGELVRLECQTDNGILLLTDYQSCGKKWTEKNNKISVW